MLISLSFLKVFATSENPQVETSSSRLQVFNLTSLRFVTRLMLFQQKAFPRGAETYQTHKKSQAFYSFFRRQKITVLASVGSLPKCTSSGWCFLSYVPCETQNLTISEATCWCLGFIWLDVRKGFAMSANFRFETSWGGLQVVDFKRFTFYTKTHAFSANLPSKRLPKTATS